MSSASGPKRTVALNTRSSETEKHETDLSFTLQVFRPIPAFSSSVTALAANKASQRQWAWKFETVNVPRFETVQTGKTFEINNSQSRGVVRVDAFIFGMCSGTADCAAGSIFFRAVCSKVTCRKAFRTTHFYADMVQLFFYTNRTPL